ncbi:MAG: tRNA pseudouridine(55) synthase TruB, partial [Alphaproteobacteria bacterium]|nr:tRNA pseudouridine(55) synthase TruB [Alphaproteobacteria bacterium]
MKHKGDKVSGWLIIDKEAGMGSTQVVGKTRYLLQAAKNGHCGTLDPFATGVLPIAFGEATKLIPYVTDGDKEYEFWLKFGVTTDTLDCEGEVVAEGGIVPSKEEIEAILPQFVGEISQVPPAFSAIKINGQRAYDLARKGQEVEIPERKITIYGLELLEMCESDVAHCRVRCSKGTYVRTLGADIAKKLGTIGYLQALRRTKCGKFDVSDTILLENLKKIEYVGERQKVLLPVITCLRDIADIAVTEADAAKLKQGQGLSPKAYQTSDLLGKEVAATCNGKLVAMVRLDERKIAPVRV